MSEEAGLELQGWSAHRAGGEEGEAGAAANDSAPRAAVVAPAAAPEGAHTEQVAQVYEHQRWLGVVGWQAPLSLLDVPPWTDTSEEGKAVALEQLPPEEPGWEIVVTPATDAHGWQYATVFKHLDYKRPGGRASQRFGDLVRRRLWQRRAGAGTATALVSEDDATSRALAAAARGSAAEEIAAAEKARAAVEAEAQRKAIKNFLGMVLDMLSRRSVFQLMPWDPTALPVLLTKHRQVIEELQHDAAQRRMFGEDTPPPPSPLRPGRADHNLLQPLQFDAVGGVSAEANNEAVAALAGLDPADILQAGASEWRNSPFRPCYYLAADRANEVIVLSIRQALALRPPAFRTREAVACPTCPANSSSSCGLDMPLAATAPRSIQRVRCSRCRRGSLQLGDLLSDLSAAPFFFELVEGVEGHVHSGMLSAASYVQCATAEALAAAGERFPGWPLLLTGHSLGGGVAALLAILLRAAGLPPGLGPLHALTFGTPAVMSEAVAAATEDFITSVVLGADIIPHLSQCSVEGLLLEARAASPVQRKVTELGQRLRGALGDAIGSATGGATGAPVRDAAASLARRASQKGLAVALSVLSGGGAGGTGGGGGAAGAAPSIPVVDLSHGESVPPEAPRQPHAIAVLREPTPEPRGAGQPARSAAAAAPPAGPSGLQPAPAAAAGGARAGAAGEAQGAQEAEEDASEAPAVCELVLGIDAAGLEGFYESAEQQQPAAGSPLQQQQKRKEREAAQQPQQLQEQRGEVHSWLAVPLAAGPDTPGVASAIAQQAAATAQGGAAPGAVTTTGPARPDPELLLPPGKIIWLFEKAPAAEQQHPASAGDADAGADVAPGGGAAPGGAGGGGEVDGEVDVQAAMERVERQREGAAANGGAGAPSGQHEQHEQREGGPPGPGSEQQQAAAKEAVAAVAERHTFSRILLLPEMVDDHVPDAYLRAVQQL
eukprot:scaffold4.g4794.t1